MLPYFMDLRSGRDSRTQVAQDGVSVADFIDRCRQFSVPDFEQLLQRVELRAGDVPEVVKPRLNRGALPILGFT